MWKYVSTTVKDTVELGINVRKFFTVQQALNNKITAYKQQQQQKQNVRLSNHLNYDLVPQYQNPSRGNRDGRGDEKFKRKYQRLYNNQRCFLNGLAWTTVIITGFYTSQLLCLYRRKQHLGFDTFRCRYSKYLLNPSKSLHQNARIFAQPEESQRFRPKFECPLQKAKRLWTQKSSQSRSQLRTVEEEFSDFKHFVDPGYNQYQKLFEGRSGSRSSAASTNVYNVNNDTTELHPTKIRDTFVKKEEKAPSAEEIEDSGLDAAIRQLAFIVSEVEFEMGVDCFLAGQHSEAVDHFRLSTDHNHPGAFFNLALCYEQGFGVKRSLKTAKRLYEISSELGHAKAFYNLGVFYAQGLGGAKKNFKEARKNFEKAAELGNVDAEEAMDLLLSPPIEEAPEKKSHLPQKPPIKSAVKEFPDDLFFLETPMISNAYASHKLSRIAIT